MVHTIFEWRKFIGSFEDALDTSGFLLLNQSLVTLDFLFGWFRTAFASVTGNRKLRHDFRQHVHALVKSHQGNSLIITVHAHSARYSAVRHAKATMLRVTFLSGFPRNGAAS